MVLHHPDWLLPWRRSQPQHQLDKIPARSFQTSGSENPGCPDDERGIEISLRVKLSGKLGNGICAERMRGIILEVGAAGRAVEHIIGGVVHESRIYLAAGERQI